MKKTNFKEKKGEVRAQIAKLLFDYPQLWSKTKPVLDVASLSLLKDLQQHLAPTYGQKPTLGEATTAVERTLRLSKSRTPRLTGTQTMRRKQAVAEKEEPTGF